MVAKKKTTKKITTSKNTKKVAATPIEKQPETMPMQQTSIENASKYSGFSFFRKPSVFIPLIVIIIGVLLYYVRGFLVVAVVNGQPISRMDFDHQMELQVGDQVLSTLIAKALLEQEANRRHIGITPDEMNKAIAQTQDSLKKQGQTLDQYFASQNITKNDFIEGLKIKLLVDKLFSKNITVSDKEIDTYLDENKNSIPSTIDPNVLRTQVKEQLRQQKLRAKVQETLRNLQKSAKIERLVRF